MVFERVLQQMRERIRSSRYVMTLHATAEMEADGQQVTCDVCGRPGARVRRVSRSYGSGADLLVIENVPVITCPHCGESYLTAETLHEIDRIKQHRKRLAIERPVEVASLA